MKLIPLTQGMFTKVSDHRYEYLMQWKWQYNDHSDKLRKGKGLGYASKKGGVRMHNLIANTPPGMICDHKDGDTLNNQDENLRNCTTSQNAMNRKTRLDSQTGYKGVRYNKKRNIPYKAYIYIDSIEVFLGHYYDPIEAAKAYDAAAIENFGEFARTNF